MLALALIMGLVIGVTLGALGGGGSILTVPAFVYVLGQNAHGATTASLVVVGATALAGAVAHMAEGRVRIREGLVFGVLGIAGSVLGSRLSSGIAPSDLMAAFSAIMLVAAAAILVRTRRQIAPAYAGPDPSGPRDSNEMSTMVSSPIDKYRPNLVVMVAAAGGVGMLTGFFGVGGGFVVVPALVLVMGFDMAVAVATSLLVIAINSGAALVARVGTPVHVDWAVVGVFAAAAICASVLGARVPGIVEPRRIARAFSVLLVVIALYTLVRSLSHL
jgi:uncharacterized protein